MLQCRLRPCQDTVACQISDYARLYQGTLLPCEKSCALVNINNIAKDLTLMQLLDLRCALIQCSIYSRRNGERASYNRANSH